MCRAPLKISLLSGLPVEILQLQLQLHNYYVSACYSTSGTMLCTRVYFITSRTWDYSLGQIAFAVVLALLLSHSCFAM